MQAIAEIAASFEVPSHIDTDLLTAFAEYEGISDMEDAAEMYSDQYAGTYESAEAWAEELLCSTGEIDAIPANLRFYFDYAAYARDCELNGDIWCLETRQGTAVFWNR